MADMAFSVTKSRELGGAVLWPFIMSFMDTWASRSGFSPREKLAAAPWRVGGVVSVAVSKEHAEGQSSNSSSAGMDWVCRCRWESSSAAPRKKLGLATHAACGLL